MNNFIILITRENWTFAVLLIFGLFCSTNSEENMTNLKKFLFAFFSSFLSFHVFSMYVNTFFTSWLSLTKQGMKLFLMYLRDFSQSNFHFQFFKKLFALWTYLLNMMSLEDEKVITLYPLVHFITVFNVSFVPHELMEISTLKVMMRVGRFWHHGEPTKTGVF